MGDVATMLAEVLSSDHIVAGEAISEDYSHDEALTATPRVPAFVVTPRTVEDVQAVINLAREQSIPLTARGSGTGLSGACIPREDGILISFEHMNSILEIDTENHVAIVQPGVTLAQLDEALKPYGLVYPVFPGESSASLGGNVATNAGGMRAIKYGVTRHQVLGLQAVLGTGDVIRTGGRFVKSTSGYELTQLIIGSEGTLAIVTEATLRLYPRKQYATTLLAPFTTLDEVTRAVPRIVGSGVEPTILEYIDALAMGGILAQANLDLGIPQDIKSTALAYLVIVLENRDADRLESDVTETGTLVAELGALDVYVLPPQAGVALISARERAFWSAKAAGANDIIDLVVPRAELGRYMATANAIANEHNSYLTGCGHVGDGNIHLSVFQADAEVRAVVLKKIFEAGAAIGGAVSGEHGIGTEKKRYYNTVEDPAKIALMRRIKVAFDPAGILNPGMIFDMEDGS